MNIALELILVALFAGFVAAQGVSFITYTQWQTGQYILYDEPYLDTTAPLQYNITYDTAFVTANSGIPAEAGVVVAGI